MAAENFDAALKLVLVHEGGWSNHPADPGGATMKGVIQRVYDAYRTMKGRPRQSVRYIDNLELREIYKRQYWDAIRGDDLPAGIDYCVFDAAVNSGPRQAAKWLQRALGVTADGIIGLVTLGAARAAARTSLIQKFGVHRLGMLRALRTWPVFGKGWFRRVSEVERDAIRMA